MSRGLAIVVGLFATLGCSRGSTRHTETETRAMARPPAPVCREHGESAALITFAGARCPWLLLEEGGAVRLRSLELHAPPDASADLPPPCDRRPCDWDGLETPLGPMVIASVRSAHSEMPEGALLGVTRGQALRFVDLWEGGGASVWDDSTPLGPAFSLAPHACGSELGLVAVARLTAGETTTAPPRLVEREGIYDFATDPPGLKPASLSRCTPIVVALP